MIKRFCGAIIVQKYDKRALGCIDFAQVSAATEQLRQVDGWMDIALKHPLRFSHPGKNLRFGEGQCREDNVEKTNVGCSARIRLRGSYHRVRWRNGLVGEMRQLLM